MKRLHIVLAKHQENHRVSKVRGAEFSLAAFRSILDDSPRDRFGAILEDQFLGMPIRLAPARDQDADYRYHLAKATAKQRAMLRGISKSIGKGHPDPFGASGMNPLLHQAMEANARIPSRVKAVFSQISEKAQSLTIGSLFLRNEAYHLAARGDFETAMDLLLKSLPSMADAVRIRDQLLIAQACALSEQVDSLIVFHGTNHRNLLSLDWPGLEMRPHLPPEDPLPYIDAALIATLSGEADPDRLRLDMAKELLFLPLFRRLRDERPDAYVEDLISLCKEEVDRSACQ